MKVLIIPDVHGRTFWKEPCKHIDEFDKTIFFRRLCRSLS